MVTVCDQWVMDLLKLIMKYPTPLLPVLLTIRYESIRNILRKYVRMMV